MSRVVCECGSNILSSSYKRHLTSIHHQSFIQRDRMRSNNIQERVIPEIEPVRIERVEVAQVGRVRRDRNYRPSLAERVERVSVQISVGRAERVRVKKLDDFEIEQNRLFDFYANEKLKKERLEKIEKEKIEKEKKRVEKRGIPKHILHIVIEHTQSTCTICFDEITKTKENGFMTKCGHIMCKPCERTLFEKENDSCPTCRSTF